MTDLRKAAEMALEALEAHADIGIKSDKQIEALREALAHHVDNVYMSEERVHKTEKSIHEPVAWMKLSGLVSPYQHGSYQIPLYTAPPKPEYATEVVAVSENGIRTVKQTTIPKKEWVGLTVNEARKFYEKYTKREELIYAIDKFLEEKNGG